MSIKARFWLLVTVFLSALTVAAIINMISSTKQQAIMSEISDALTASQNISTIGRLMESNLSQILYALQYDPARPDLAASHYFPITLYFDQVSTNANLITESWETYLKTNTAVHVKEETELFQMVRAEYLKVGLMGIIDLMKANNFADAYVYFQQQSEPLLMNARPVADMIAAKVTERVDLLEAEAEATTKIMNWLLQGTVLIAILFGVALSIYSIRIIGNNLNAGKSWANHLVTTGELSNRITLHHKDEISDMLNDIQRAFSHLDTGMTQARMVMGAIANADFSQRMTGQYVGDLATLQQGVNGSAERVDLMMRELGKVMEGINAGRFDVKMDSQVPQAFRDLVETGLNNINRVVQDINTVMAQMNEANFDAKVNADAQGSLLIMKDNINNAMQNISSVIHSIVQVVEAQAQGDLTQGLPSGTYRGQFHGLKNAMAYSMQKVKEIVIQAVDTSNIVNEEAVQVSQGAAELSERVQKQAQALEQTSSTMNEMASEVLANTANARKVADLALSVRKQSTDGAAVMQETITAMQSIRESSSKIADIVTLIDGIAFQTNLLALNAAVEAARAGEHGRGFAVVASEVRALAGKSADAAKDIKTLISDSVQRIEVGTSLADKSGEMLSGITASVAEVAGMIDEIAKVSHEQSVGIGHVRSAVAQIDDLTQQNAALVEETTAAAEHLSEQANGLRESMRFFNTGKTSQPINKRLAGKTPEVAKTTPKAPPKTAIAALPAPAASDTWTEF